ncbi:hypothetical protein F3Y22_tig00111812pilonHSYRG00026 [Hibiscus syriacus]|uniref:pectinesterase n=1 Tax=Hibiscus syriacus TaxID=106335 RepID=A0A6A2YEU3_HIBSY|nr:hypothetical protein F3Y22_tig00111812pilonHSYRG00026 [Hibiscus syriacus]
MAFSFKRIPIGANLRNIPSVFRRFGEVGDGFIAITGARLNRSERGSSNVAPIPRPGDVGVQAVAIRIAGDQAAFWGCGPVAPGSKSINGAVMAHGRASAEENSGFEFVNCTVVGTRRIWFGRAWKPLSPVIFAFTSMTDIIVPEGWSDFNDPTRDHTLSADLAKGASPGTRFTRVFAELDATCGRRIPGDVPFASSTATYFV